MFGIKPDSKIIRVGPDLFGPKHASSGVRPCHSNFDRGRLNLHLSWWVVFFIGGGDWFVMGNQYEIIHPNVK